jgi:hypothetical protein
MSSFFDTILATMTPAVPAPIITTCFLSVIFIKRLCLYSTLF